jgi:hypothetical protein
MALTPQQLLAEEAPLLLVTEPEATRVTEGNNGQVTFTLENISGKPGDLSFSPFVTTYESGDASDNLKITNPNIPGIFLKPGVTDTVSVTFHTPGGAETSVENGDLGENLISDTAFFLGNAFQLSANVTVYDVVPEASSLVLVGVCVLSVCGFAWLRRRKTLSEV